MATKRIIDVKVLPGESTNGSGKVCIHLFVPNERGPFVEPSALHVVDKQLVSRPTRGMLACDPNRNVAQVVRGGVTTVTPRSDDPRAVTCPRCISSRHYVEMSDKIAQAEAAR